MILQKTMQLNEIEGEVAQQQRDIDEEQRQLNQKIAEIKLDTEGKFNCLFNPQDPIFSLSEQAHLPTDEEKQKLVQMAALAGLPFMCNTCCVEVSSMKKLKFCQFCA